MNNDQQPGGPQQPNHNGWQQPNYPEPPAYGQQPGADQYNADQYNYNQPPYGQPGPGQYGQAPPKSGFPVWGWVASGVGAVAVLAVGGVMVLGVLGSGKGGEAAPGPMQTSGSSESAGAAEEAADDESSAAASGDEDLYIFQDADFTSPPVWSVKMPAGWTMSDVKDGTTQYRSSDNPCIFTTRQTVIPASGPISDEEATKTSMQGEISGVKNAASSPVTVVTDADSVYAKLRNDDGHVIEMQEAELRFKNKSNVDLVLRMAVRAVPSSNGLMGLDLVCPANLPTEADVWMELTDSATMMDDPAA